MGDVIILENNSISVLGSLRGFDLSSTEKRGRNIKDETAENHSVQILMGCTGPRGGAASLPPLIAAEYKGTEELRGGLKPGPYNSDDRQHFGTATLLYLPECSSPEPLGTWIKCSALYF